MSSFSFDSVERYTGLGVDVRLGHARLVDPWTVTIQAKDGSETSLTSRSIVVATGTTVYYCYEVTNTGDVTFEFHTLEDDVLARCIGAIEAAGFTAVCNH